MEYCCIFPYIRQAWNIFVHFVFSYFPEPLNQIQVIFQRFFAVFCLFYDWPHDSEIFALKDSLYSLGTFNEFFILVNHYHFLIAHASYDRINLVPYRARRLLPLYLLFFNRSIRSAILRCSSSSSGNVGYDVGVPPNRGSPGLCPIIIISFVSG